jgi:23S rRNA pseudouridine2605 synthase
MPSRNSSSDRGRKGSPAKRGKRDEGNSSRRSNSSKPDNRKSGRDFDKKSDKGFPKKSSRDYGNKSEGRFSNKSEGRFSNKSEGRAGNKPEGRFSATKSEGRFGGGKSEGRSGNKSEGRFGNKSEGRFNNKSEGRFGNKSEGRSDKRFGEKSEGRFAKKFDKSSDRFENKSEKRFGDRSEKRYGDRSDKRSGERSDKKFGDRPNKGYKKGFDSDKDSGKRTYSSRSGSESPSRFSKPRFKEENNGEPVRRSPRRSDSSEGGFPTDRKGPSKRGKFSSDESPRFEKGGGSKGKSSSRTDRSSGRVSNRDEEFVGKAPIQTEAIRLNRFIANSGVCSRREADELIGMGLISVNGKAITEMGYKVNPGDVVRYEDKVLKAEKPVYILLNKPKGYLTTTSDPEERKTVMHLVANAVKERVYPVGRLDRNTTGLLLLTNDGDLADKLMHPSYNVKKIYKVELDKPLSRADFAKIQEGIQLEEGKAVVDDIAIVSDDGKTVGVELHIGWNRVVRRIFESLEYQVIKLDRSVYAGLDKKDLPRGHWRFLRKEEVVRLKHYK